MLSHMASRSWDAGTYDRVSDVQDRWADATGVELRQGYGLTEGAPVCRENNHTTVRREPARERNVSRVARTSVGWWP